MRSFALPPDRIDGEHTRSRLQLIRGEVLPVVPRGALPVAGTLPYGLGDELGGPEVVVARVDVEESVYHFALPRRELVERARAFYIADESGRALVRLTDGDGRLQPDVELHLDDTFSTRDIAGVPRRIGYVRTLRVGDPVYVLGRPQREADDSGLGGAGYRDLPRIAVFAGNAGALHLYDEPAYRQLAAWHGLPWYRKLSVLVRNR